MSVHVKEEAEGQCVLAVTEVTALYQVWLRFLDAAADYTKRYYLLKDLREEVHNPQSDVVLARYYDGKIRNLQLVIQQDIERLEGEILEIRRYQRELGMGGFRVDGESFSRFIDHFSLLEYLAPARRSFYRRRVRRELRKFSPVAVSLNDLEAAFKSSKSYATALQKASP